MRPTRAVLMIGLLSAVLCSVALSAQMGDSAQPPAPAFQAAGMDSPAVFGGDTVPDLVVAPASGAQATHVFSGAGFGFLGGGFPFNPNFVGGVRVAAGDINGDGVADVVAGQGPGGSLVTLIDGATILGIGSGHPFGAGFRGGVHVATADINGDGLSDIVVGQGTGGGRVMVFNGADISLLMNLTPFGPGFTGGVTVAAGDVNGDGFADVFVGQASAGGAVALIDGATHALIAAAPVFGASGVSVALGDVNGDGRDDAIMAPHLVNGPVIVYDVLTLTQLAAFVPYGPASAGVRVASTDFNGDGFAEIVTGPGPGGGSTIHVFSGGTFGLLSSFAAFGPAFNGGVYVAAPSLGRAPTFTSPAAATFTVGQPGSFTVTTTGVPSVTSVTQIGALPAGVTFTNNGDGTATLSGTPSGPGGSFPLTLAASNGVGAPATQNFVLSVNQAPAITSADSGHFTINVAGTLSIVSTGFPSPTLSLAGALPTGVTFTPNGDGTATLAGTPTQAGVFDLTITASNAAGEATQAFELTVDGSPVFTSAAATTFTVGTPGTFTITTVASPAVTSISQTGSLPAGVIFTSHGDGTATLSGTPTASGSFPLTFAASNGVGTPTEQAFLLTVNQSPAITSAASATFPIGAPFSFTVTTTGFPVPTIAMSGTLPGVGFTDNGNGTGTLSGTPSAGGTVTFTAANGVATADVQSFALTVSPVAQDESFVGAVGNTQFVVGAGAPATPHVLVGGNVLGNDAGTGTLTAGPAVIASTNGGQVAMAATGTFVYTPAVGFAGPQDTFTYTMTDGNGLTDTATVTIGIGGRVWYVNEVAPGVTGASNSPFGNMTAAASASGPGDAIYVHAGAPAGSTVLEAGQTLAGAGANFVLGNLAIPATTSPTLGGTVALADNVLVSGITVSTGGSDAITAAGVTGTVTLSQVAITGGATGIFVNGGTATMNIGATIAGTTVRAVDVRNKTAGVVTFSGQITSAAGEGVFLDNNDGATVAFTGGMALATTAAAANAFTAINGGTVTATQSAPAIVNTLSAEFGVALRVVDTGIGAAGLNFQSIDAGNGGPTPGAGIILDNTGVAAINGGLTVTGDGSGLARSGGLIQRKSGVDGVATEGVGIYLNSTRNVNLNWMELFRFDNWAIVGRNVHGFVLANSSIDEAGTTAGISEGPLVFGTPSGLNGIVGTAVIRDSVIRQGFEDNAAFYNQSGSMELTIDRSLASPEGSCQIGFNSLTTGRRGLVLQMEGTATANVTFSRCRLRDNRTTALYATAADTASLTLLVSGASNEPILANLQGVQGIVVSNSDAAHIDATIQDVSIDNFPGGAIWVGQGANATGASLLQARLINNNIFSPANSTTASILGRFSSAAGQVSQARVLITNHGTPDAAGIDQRSIHPGIDISTVAGTPQVDVTLLDNHVDMEELVLDTGVGGDLGIAVRSTMGSVCANVRNNFSHWHPVQPTGDGGFLLEQAAPGLLTLERGESVESDAALVLEDNNPSPPGALMAYDVPLTSVISVVDTACQVPTPPAAFTTRN